MLAQAMAHQGSMTGHPAQTAHATRDAATINQGEALGAEGGGLANTTTNHSGSVGADGGGPIDQDGARGAGDSSDGATTHGGGTERCYGGSDNKCGTSLIRFDIV